ncbi:MAG: 4Fe-4S dicluster domain-containing protein [Candidatus Auribacter fodinae]|uniref:4Fe-4S dicluster domain-containing protein n=1 Tax=Candidatus Auribacter fodinae TaxID=2093366 RepID=A0A3A4QV10_9BACT|nr:MAG: 4Fe-4S dicluster domain-containing protein [Candidatus Auribacter fodinae]
MMYDNKATMIRRELMVKIAQLYFKGTLCEEINRIPIEMFPKRSGRIRCCIHKDRAMIKYRCIAILGHRVEDEADELKPLSEYAREALERTEIDPPVLTVLDEGCSSCVKVNYFVTNACQGCVARPCMINCPRKAISMENGHARIDNQKCVNCGLCKKACPYHAIIYMPVPCEEACPVNAISKDEYGREQIDYDKCIYCGKCSRECPFGAIMERSQIIDVLKQLSGDKQVIAMVAPAIIGQFPTDYERIIQAIKELGFSSVAEVALGADITAANEAHEFAEKMHENQPFMTTSCCPAYTEAVKKHIPDMQKYVSTTQTPMYYTADMIRERNPEAVTVFIGPCIAKRHEAMNNTSVDYVLTIEELGSLLVAKGIDVNNCAAEPISEPAQNIGRGFPVVGGVTDAIRQTISPDMEFKPFVVDGLTCQSLKVLQAAAKGKAPGNFIEVMCCEGGCVAGPGVISNPKVAAAKVKKMTGQK